MLCKITMRAALAPVIGFLGLVFATTSGAQIDLTGDKAPTPLKYAAESLTSDYGFKQATVIQFYKLKATVGDLILNATTDTLLPGDDRYYVRYDFAGGRGVGFTRDLVAADMQYRLARVSEGNLVLDSSLPASAVAWGGEKGDSAVIFQATRVDQEFIRGSRFDLDLSRTTGPGDGDDAARDPSLVLAVRGSGAITAQVSVYDDLADARRGTAASNFETLARTILDVKTVVDADIKSMYDTADVGNPDTAGGPFRRFVEDDDDSDMGGGRTSGVLGTTEVTVNGSYKDAVTGASVTGSIVSHTEVVVTSDAGNFAVSLGAGGTVNTKVRKPWMLASKPACADGPLTLGVANGSLATYATDPDGKGGLVKGDLTPAGIQAATMASGNAAKAVGKNFFCVNVDGNVEPIPEIGDPTAEDSYTLTVTPVLSSASKRAVEPESETKDVGAIDRNGTTVNITYLTANPFVDQRLVIVNRGNDAVEYWVENFYLEDGTTITPANNGLSLDSGPHMVPEKGRAVVKVSDAVEFDGQARGSATVNVAAPKMKIDVMTVQRSPFTDEVDTTLYQNQ